MSKLYVRIFLRRATAQEFQRTSRFFADNPIFHTQKCKVNECSLISRRGNSLINLRNCRKVYTKES